MGTDYYLTNGKTSIRIGVSSCGWVFWFCEYDKLTLDCDFMYKTIPNEIIKDGEKKTLRFLPKNKDAVVKKVKNINDVISMIILAVVKGWKIEKEGCGYMKKPMEFINYILTRGKEDLTTKPPTNYRENERIDEFGYQFFNEFEHVNVV